MCMLLGCGVNICTVRARENQGAVTRPRDLPYLSDAEPVIVHDSKSYCEIRPQLADMQHRIVEGVVITVDPPHKVYLLPYSTADVLVQAAEFPRQS